MSNVGLRIRMILAITYLRSRTMNKRKYEIKTKSSKCTMRQLFLLSSDSKYFVPNKYTILSVLLNFVASGNETCLNPVLSIHTNNKKVNPVKN